MTPNHANLKIQWATDLSPLTLPMHCTFTWKYTVPATKGCVIMRSNKEMILTQPSARTFHGTERELCTHLRESANAEKGGKEVISKWAESVLIFSRWTERSWRLYGLAAGDGWLDGCVLQRVGQNFRLLIKLWICNPRHPIWRPSSYLDTLVSNHRKIYFVQRCNEILLRRSKCWNKRHAMLWSTPHSRSAI